MTHCPKCGCREIPLYVKRLRQIRKAKGFSQEDVALSLGVCKAYVGYWETGLQEPQNLMRERWRYFLVDGPAWPTVFYGKQER